MRIDWACAVFYAALCAILAAVLLLGYVVGKAHAEDACRAPAAKRA